MCFFVFVFPPLISQTLTLMATAVHLLVNHRSVFKVPPFMLFIVVENMVIESFFESKNQLKIMFLY